MNRRALIAFRNKLVEGNNSSSVLVDPTVVLSFQAELMRLGYSLTQRAYDELANCSQAYVTLLYSTILEQARDDKGASKKYTPLWKNFPQDVMDASMFELYLTAVLHYWTSGSYEPNQELRARGFEFEAKTFIELDLAKDNWLEEIATNLASFSKPLDAQSLDDLIWIVKNDPALVLPPITVKETLAAVVAAGAKIKVKNPVDVLRVAVAMSGGDVSLSKLPSVNALNARKRYDTIELHRVNEERNAQKFKNFSRAERRTLLGMLEELHTIDVGEMARHLGRWKRLGEKLHPGEYKDMFPKSYAAFQALRNQDDVKVRTFAGRTDLAFKDSFKDGVNVLSSRPGEYARKLDWLLRTASSSPQIVLNTFSTIADKVSSKVLFEMHDHFEGRLKEQPRMVQLKGSGSKSKVLANLPPLPADVVHTVQATVEQSLERRAAKLPAMGKTYIDEELFQMPVPFSMQSSSEGAATFVRGTRFPLLPGATTLRAFVHWYDERGNIDVDLSGVFMDEDFKSKAEISFYDLKSSTLEAYHSGDIRHRAGHNAEYVDFDIAQARKAGVRYVLFSVYNYNGNSMGSVPEASFGVMERSKPKSNEIFDPATAPQAIKLKAKSTSCYPVLIDLEKHEYIWIDMESDTGGYASWRGANTLEIAAKLKAITGNIKLSVAHLLALHVKARGGELVDNPVDADETFFATDFNKSYTKLAPFLAI